MRAFFFFASTAVAARGERKSRDMREMRRMYPVSAAHPREKPQRREVRGDRDERERRIGAGDEQARGRGSALLLDLVSSISAPAPASCCPAPQGRGMEYPGEVEPRDARGKGGGGGGRSFRPVEQRDDRRVLSDGQRGGLRLSSPPLFSSSEAAPGNGGHQTQRGRPQGDGEGAELDVRQRLEVPR